MTQLSRKQKYQELRDRLDEETTAAQAQPVKLQRLVCSGYYFTSSRIY